MMDTDATDDAGLLASFAATRSEEAFAALVRRHGGMVHRTCRQVLRDGQDADDAAQAVFVVLARSAGRLAGLRSLAAWLHRVAVRVALNIRTAALRRARHEKEAAMQPAPVRDDDLARFLPHLDEALEGLSEAYRQPLILHHLEGRSYADCCRILGCNEGVLSMRLSRGRERLRRRLAARGAAVSAVALGTLLGQTAAAGEMPAAVAAGAVQAAGGGAVAAPVAALAKGTLSMLFWMKVKATALAAAAVLVVGSLAVPVVVHAMAAEMPKAVPAQSPASAFVRPAVDPQLAAVLARRVELVALPPLTWDAAIERILCALPPGDRLPARLLRQGSMAVAIRDPQRTADIERHLDRAGRRLLTLLDAGTVQEQIDAMARQMDAEWIAAGDTVVFAPRFPAELRQRLFAPFADRGRPRDERLAAAHRIVEAMDADGLAALLRAQAATGDADGAEIASVALAEHRGALLNDAGLSALVRRRLDAGEAARLAGAALERHRVSGAAFPDIVGIRLLAFLGDEGAVPLLVHTLRESRDVAGLGKLLSKLAKGGDTPDQRRGEAAIALGRIGGGMAVQALLNAFATETRQQAVGALLEGLGLARDPAAIAPITTYLGAHAKDDHVAWERRGAIAALGAIGDPGAEPAVLAALSAASDHAMHFIGEPAVAALPRLHGDGTWQAMSTLMIDGPNETIRQVAARVLAALREPRSADALLKALRSRGTGSGGEWIRRDSAAQALSRIADPAIMAELQGIVLESGDESLVRSVAQALAGARHPQAQTMLLDAFRRARDSSYRIQSIGAALDPAQSATVAAALRAIAISDPVAVRRGTAAAQLGRCGPDGLAFLLDRVDRETTPEARMAMVWRLDGSATSARNCLFRLAASDRDEPVRIQAIWQLARSAPDARLMPVLTRLLTGDPNPRVRGACASALASLAEADRSAVEPDGGFDPAAIRAAFAQRQSAAIDALIAALGRDASAEVRRAVVNTKLLHSSGPAEDRLAAAFLAALATEKDPEVQRGLVAAFFLRMRVEPALTPVMLGILRDAGRAAAVRDQACRNLEAAHRQDDEVTAAIRDFRRAAQVRPARPAPAPAAAHDF